MSGEAKRVLFNAFEVALTSDLNRAQVLGSRALQEALAAQYGRSFFSQPVPQWMSFPSPIAPSGVFDVDVPAGTASYRTTAPVTADESEYQFIQWPFTTLTPLAADPVNPRIDLVVVTPVALPGGDTDPLLRNVLVNPTTRTINGITVNKTRTPLGVVSIVPGTPAVVPVPAAVPAGALALFEIKIPALAATSGDFAMSPRLFRASSGLGNGVMQNGVLETDEGLNIMRLKGGFHRISLEGEIIEFTVGATFPSFPDTLNNPFAAPAPVNVDRPYYVYFVGGHLGPQQTDRLPVPEAVPYCLVESLTAPVAQTGRPFAAINTPRGAVTTTALYLGMGFVRRGTIIRKTLLRAGQWVLPGGADNNFERTNFTAPIAASPATTPISLVGRPVISRMAKVTVQASNAGAGAPAFVHFNPNAVANEGEVMFNLSTASPGADAAASLVAMLPAAPELTVNRVGGDATTNYQYQVRAYLDQVLRLDGAGGDVI